MKLFGAPLLALTEDLGASNQGRSPIGKIATAGAVELKDGKTPGRIRLMPIAGYDRKTLHAFVTSTTAIETKVIARMQANRKS